MDIKVYEQLPEDAQYIRRKVFMEEQGFENEFDDIDDVSIHIVIYENSNPVATCRLYFSEERSNYVIGRIAVLEEYRGKNYGGELLKVAEKEVIKRQGNSIELSAQVRVSAFYVKNGYVASDEVYEDEGCPHVWMKKELNRNLELVPIVDSELSQFKLSLQEAFQKGYEAHFGKTNEIILPEKDIDQSLNSKGAIAYKAVLEGEFVGGAVVVINQETQHNHLDLLFVKTGTQSKGIGKAIWFQIEKLHPVTKSWETCTPYFEVRNIHFYVNVCGFHITEFFNEKHPMPDMPDDFIGDGNEGMLKFIKQM